MLKERAREVSALVALCDTLLLCAAFLTAFQVRSFLVPRWYPALPTLALSSSLWLLFLSVPTFLVLFQLGGVYGSLRTKSFLDLLLLVGRPIGLGGLFLGSAIFVTQAKYFSRSLFGLFLATFFLAVLSEKIAIRLSQRYVRRKGFNYRSVVIVGINESSMRMGDVLTKNADYGFKVAGFVNGFAQDYVQADNYKVLGSIDELVEIVDRHIVDEVIFALPVDQLPRCENQILKCEEIGLKIHIRADFAHSIFARTYLGWISNIPILTLATSPHSASDIVLKRLMDLVVSVLGLALAAPAMVAMAVLIKLDSRGPVFFRQVRSGLNGRRFSLLKFRSMVHDAERQREALQGLNEMSGPVFKMQRDPRVTRIGGFLRRTSLDELPQLWNVLRGDMSLVGPRPALPAEVQKYQRWQRRRLSIKPGLTCLWQVNGRNSVDFDQWMKLDMQYIDNWSLGLDFKILAKTIPAVLFSRGAH